MSSLQVRTNRALNEKNAPEVLALIQDCRIKAMWQARREQFGISQATRTVALDCNIPANVVNAARYYW